MKGIDCNRNNRNKHLPCIFTFRHPHPKNWFLRLNVYWSHHGHQSQNQVDTNVQFKVFHCIKQGLNAIVLENQYSKNPWIDKNFDLFQITVYSSQ